MVFDWRRVLRFALFVATLFAYRVAAMRLADLVPAGTFTWLARALGAETASHVIFVALIALMIVCALFVYWLTSKALGLPMRDGPR
ncbi:hypothetical protein ASD79_14760 [Caulobacter sp. Root655]|nr:hypothetical protein ASD79_14760 [Caulobacter sp. Root655]